MPLFDWLRSGRKPVGEMDVRELRRQELRLEKERDGLLRRVERLAQDKQILFDRGAAERTPEVRRALAQQFELTTAEQLMLSRQLNIRAKELLTVSRLRMIRQNMEQARRHGDRLGLICEADMARMQRLIDSDAVTAEMYQERLDDMLGAAAGIAEGSPGLSPAGQEVMDIWKKMDSGALPAGSEAFEEADRRVREAQEGEKV